MDDLGSYYAALQNQVNLNNSWSAEQAQKQMDFQERMSNTAHQREVADLKAAGLNPILSARLGGASTPSGASATADTSIVPAMVQLMDKMLDVQGTSAAAAYNASGGADATVGYDSGTSGKSNLSDEEQADLFNLFTGKGRADADTISALRHLTDNVLNTGKTILDKGSDAVKTYVAPTAGNLWNKIVDSTKNAVKFWQNPIKAIEKANAKKSGSGYKTGKDYSKSGVTVRTK